MIDEGWVEPWDWDDWTDHDNEDDQDDRSAWEVVCESQPPAQLPAPEWWVDESVSRVYVPADGRPYLLGAVVSLMPEPGYRPIVGAQIVNDEGEAVLRQYLAAPGTCALNGVTIIPGQYRLELLGARIPATTDTPLFGHAAFR